MKIDLKCHTAVITGGTSGIGLATAGLFLEAGANVAICGRDQTRLDDATATLTAAHSDANLLAASCDVLDKDSVANFVEKTVERFSGVDTLVNNAGQARVSNYEDTSEEAWREELNLKFFSVLYPSKSFQPHFPKVGSSEPTLHKQEKHLKYHRAPEKHLDENPGHSSHTAYPLTNE